jgi:hypothetical protein
LEGGEIGEVRQGGMGVSLESAGFRSFPGGFRRSQGSGPRGVCPKPCRVAIASSPTYHEIRTAGQHHEDLGSRFRRE